MTFKSHVYGPAKEETQEYDVGCFQSICVFSSYKMRLSLLTMLMGLSVLYHMTSGLQTRSDSEAINAGKRLERGLDLLGRLAKQWRKEREEERKREEEKRKVEKDVERKREEERMAEERMDEKREESSDEQEQRIEKKEDRREERREETEERANNLEKELTKRG